MLIPFFLRHLFRFHTGSIKRLIQNTAQYLPNTCFDSILVRLKVYCLPLVLASASFRFHTGSIKSHVGIDSTDGTKLFRFHTGSIKSTQKPVSLWLGVPRFDSILVRLKARFGVHQTQSGVSLFRFHTGSIKRCRYPCTSD